MLRISTRETPATVYSFCYKYNLLYSWFRKKTIVQQLLFHCYKSVFISFYIFSDKFIYFGGEGVANLLFLTLAAKAAATSMNESININVIISAYNGFLQED